MVLFKDGKVYLKLVYWGMAGSGKTTILQTLYKLTKETKKDIIPIGNLQIIARESGATLYFDRGLFQSTKQKQVYYRVFTVAGQSSFSPLRIKLFDKPEDKTDAVIYVIDSQTKFLEDNIESLRELKSVANDKLIKEIPFIVMLNKQDLKEIIDKEDFIQILINEKLWYEPGNSLNRWNPIIYETCALYDQEKDIYRSFQTCARRTALYQIYGGGKVPGDDNNEFFPHPYIFKPPGPPGDLGVDTQAQIKISIKKKPESKIYCQYCGKELTEDEQFSHNCRKRP